MEKTIVYLNNYDKIHIGKNVILNDAFLDTNGEIFIGDNVFFGHGVKILTGYHDYMELGFKRQTAIYNKSVVIKDGVWVASFSIILPGVTIGENAVVGAGSVVTKDVAANAVVVGNPAKIIKYIKA